MTNGLTCDVCGYHDQSAASMVVHECNDGVVRCKICRQKAVYGRVLTDAEEEAAYISGAGDRSKDVKG